MAPEVLMPKPEDSSLGYTKAVDMWSFGILLCDMISGQTPFDGGSNNPMTIYSNIVKGNMKLPRYQDKETLDLIIRLL